MSSVSGEDAAAPAPPGWLDLVVRSAGLAVVSLGLVGLPLALVGAFRPRYVAPGVAVVFLALTALWGSWQLGAAPARPRAGRLGQLAGAAAVAIALVSVYVNSTHNSQHLLVDGDPGVYGATGQILARSGGLTVPTYAHSLFGGLPSINVAGAGFFPTDGGARVYPQFFHLLPALLAVGQWIGGTGALLAVNPWVGGVGLLAVYAFAARLLRPAWALVVLLTVAVLLPQLHFTRDLFSEIPSQLLVFAGLSLLWDVTSPGAGRVRRSGGRRRAGGQLAGGLVAGLVLGGSTMARVDAFFYLLPVAAGLLLLRAGRTGLAVMVGMLVPTAVALADGYFGSPAYLASIRGPLAETVAGLVVLAAAALYLRRDRAWVPRLGSRLALPAGVVVVLLAAFAWFVRPYVEVTRDIPARTNAVIAGLQQREGLRVDVPRAYDEQTVHWLAWYLGPVALALGVLAAAYFLVRLLRGRGARQAPFVLLVLAVTAVYVWRPGIFPVQYWASRRFVPVTFPGLVLLALLLCQLAWQRGQRIVAVLAAAAVLAFPVALLPQATLPRDYNGLLSAVQTMCGSLLPRDVVLLIGSPVAEGLPQVVEGSCGVPAGSAGQATTPADVAAVTASVHAAGRRLVLLSATPDPPLAPAGTSFRQLFDVTVPTQALAISHRPDEVYPDRIRLFAAYLPPG